MLERLTETQREFVLFETREVALPAVPGTPVIDVLALLDFSCNGAALVCAAHQSAKGDFLRTVLWPIMACEH